MNTLPELLAAAVKTRARIAQEIAPVLAVYPVTKHLALLDAHDPVGSYQYRSEALLRYERELLAAFPEETRRFHAVIMLQLIERSLARIDSLKLPSDVADRCVRNCARIIGNIDASDIDYMYLNNDRYDKDLAAASLRLLCAGVMKVHPVYALERLPKRKPLTWAKCLLHVGPRGTFYEGHVDTNDPLSMAEFTEDGWNRFHLNVAGLLERCSVQGLMGASWFYDPALQEVSPHLGYLRRLVMENGGLSVNMGTRETDIANATRWSATRKRAYSDGRYVPVSYLLIWLRKDLLDWARRARQPAS